MDLVEPERECLQFHIDPGELPEELVGTVQTIKETAEKVLFRWKKFPLRLPAPVFELPPALLGTDSDGRKTHTTSLRDVFTTPNFEEADVVSRDAKGRPPRLDQTQLRSIRDHGEFEVCSRAFPGRKHRWRLSRAVQSGRVGTRGLLLRDVALALRLLVVTGRNRIDSHFLSLKASALALSRATFLLLDALVGLPSVSASLLTSRLQEERVKHLVAELTIEINDLDKSLNRRQYHSTELADGKAKCRYCHALLLTSSELTGNLGWHLVKKHATVPFSQVKPNWSRSASASGESVCDPAAPGLTPLASPSSTRNLNHLSD